MKTSIPIALLPLTIAVACTWSAACFAGVSPEEAAQLGKTLTLTGAIKAGNADGSIPEYTGGLTKPPAGYQSGASRLVDPFASETPILKIDASNMAAYGDKLSDGVKHLLSTRKGYYLNVYPSHRTVAFTEAIVQKTVANASKPDCTTGADGVTLSKACRGGLPFPIPKTGYEVMWNKLAAPAPVSRSETRNWLVDASGNRIMTSHLLAYSDRLNYYSETRQDKGIFNQVYASVLGPARKAGELQGFSDNLDPLNTPRRAWAYSPGQRRVKMAPEFSYDTPNAALGGAVIYDEIFLFSGAMDRFQFKLVGKKEMYIPYNNYKLLGTSCGAETLLKGDHINPLCERWELHRVWVVEATLKPGQRHIYSKRRYYWDEDSYSAGLYDSWDQSGQLYRTGYGYCVQVYDPQNLGPFGANFPIFDLNKGIYAYQSEYTPDGKGVVFGKPMSELQLQPEAIAGGGVR